MEVQIPSKPKGLIRGKPIVVTELVSYQEGTIVSREILKKQTGNVTLFALDVGLGLSEHTSPYDAIAHVLEGEAEITVQGESHHVSAGEMILLPANNAHSLRAIVAFKMVLIMIRS